MHYQDILKPYFAQGDSSATREVSVPNKWFFTRRDGTRIGPFSPLILNLMASGDELQASSKIAEETSPTPRSENKPMPTVTGPDFDPVRGE